MKEKKEIGTISFQIDKEELERIASTGNLASFVETVTEHFRQNLKAELVSSVASGTTSLVYMGDERYGTGPKGPFPHIFAELKTITDRMEKMEVAIKRNIAIER
jgi:hypothetical protein